MVSDLASIENRVNVCKEFTHLWSEFFSMFADGLHDKKITEADENKFSKILTALSFNQFKFEELMGEKFKNAEDIIGVLSQSVSLAHLKSISEAQFSKLQIDWHTIFIEMNKSLGRLINELSPVQLEELQTHGRLFLPSQRKGEKKSQQKTG